MSRKNVKTLGFSVLILAIAILLAVMMIRLNRKEAESKPSMRYPIISAAVITPATRTFSVEATGTIAADKEVVVIPQVAGRITYISSKLIPGGQFKKGEVLARIDDRDYALMVEQKRSAVKAAEIELQREQAKGDIARREWKLSGESGEASPLAARTLQLENAKLNLEAARSGLKQAELQLERTTLRAPFSATVVTEQVDVGQVVGIQSQICKLVGNRKLRLELAIPVETLKRITTSSTKKKGSRVEVIQIIGGGQVLRAQGEVTHIVGEMDRKTRRARVIVSVPQQPVGDGNLSILPGAFVNAVIYGQDEPDVYAIPRKAVSDGNRIWTLASDTTLQSTHLQLLWDRGDSVFARLNIPEIRLMTTLLPAPVNGIKVQWVD